jgi:hypothetical protein
VNDATVHAALERARDLEGVIAAADHFVKAIAETEWGSVPRSYRPRSITSRADLAHWVVRLENCIPAHSVPAVREFLRHALARADEIGPHRAAPAGRRFGLAEAVVARRDSVRKPPTNG